jgi:hypothetical protein
LVIAVLGCGVGHEKVEQL